MVRRLERIDLFSDDYSEIIEEYEKDIEQKRIDGWRLVSCNRNMSEGEYNFTYYVERMFPFNQSFV